MYQNIVIGGVHKINSDTKFSPADSGPSSSTPQCFSTAYSSVYGARVNT